MSSSDSNCSLKIEPEQVVEVAQLTNPTFKNPEISTFLKCSDENCNFQTHNTEELCRHLLNHKRRFKYQCKICNVKFNRRSSIKLHNSTRKHCLAAGLMLSNFRCLMCNDLFYSFENVQEHVMNIHKIRKNFSQKFELYKNKNAKEFEVDSESSESSLQSFNPPPDSNGFKCRHCNKIFEYKSMLIIHELTHKRKIICPVCSKKVYKANRDEHMEVHFNKKCYICDYCGLRFGAKSLILRHMSTHSKIKRFQCKQCGRGFSRNYIYQNHILTHIEAKPFKCDLCNREYTNKRNIKYHMIANHQTERKFYCMAPFCDFSTVSNQVLRGHRTTHLSKFECKKCKYVTNKKELWNAHCSSVSHLKALKLDKSEFKCMICKKCFAGVETVRSHVKKVHGKKSGPSCYKFASDEKLQGNKKRRELKNNGIYIKGNNNEKIESDPENSSNYQEMTESFSIRMLNQSPSKSVNVDLDPLNVSLKSKKFSSDSKSFSCGPANHKSRSKPLKIQSVFLRNPARLKKNLDPTDLKKSLGPKVLEENSGPKDPEENLSPEKLEKNSSPTDLERNLGPTDSERNLGPTDLEENLSPTDLEENLGPKDLEKNSSPTDLERNLGPTDSERNLGPTDLEENLSPKDLEKNSSPTDLERNLGQKNLEENLDLRDLERNLGPTSPENISGPKDLEKNLGPADLRKNLSSTDLEKKLGTIDLDQNLGLTDFEKNIRPLNFENYLRYRCIPCKRHFKLLKFLRNHNMSVYHLQKTGLWCKDFKCRLCGKIINSIDRIRDHIKNDHKRKKHINVCYKFATQQDKIDQDYRKISESEGTTSEENSELSESDSMDDQEVTDEQIIMDEFKCRHCNETFKFKSMLIIHELTHKRKINCKICKKKIYLANRDEHMEIHLNKKSYTCDYCGLRFGYKCLIREHLLNHRKIKKIYCKQCGQGFNFPSQLYNHELGHLNRKFQCDMCGKEYRRKMDIKHHIFAYHQKECLLYCVAPFCNFSTNNSAVLYKHRTTHLRSFKCKTCRYKTKNFHCWKMHCASYKHIKAVKLDSSEFKCLICEKCFIGIETVRTHVRHFHRVANITYCYTIVSKDINKEGIRKRRIKNNGIFIKGNIKEKVDCEAIGENKSIVQEPSELSQPSSIQPQSPKNTSKVSEVIEIFSSDSECSIKIEQEKISEPLITPCISSSTHKETSTEKSSDNHGKTNSIISSNAKEIPKIIEDSNPGKIVKIIPMKKAFERLSKDLQTKLKKNIFDAMKRQKLN